MTPLTREEVLSWPAKGPLTLRILALITERDLLLEKDPKVRLDGYRELGAKCAQLEEERDAALALAYIGDHRFPDLTWKSRCEEEHTRAVGLEKERDEARERERQLFKIHVADGSPCHHEQAGGPNCVNDAHYRPPTYDDWMKPQREVMRLQNELTLAQASAAGAGGLLLDVQQDSIRAVKRAAELLGALKDAMWVADRFGDTLNDMDVAGEDEKFDEINERMDRARAVLETPWDPSGVPEWDSKYDQQKKCVCGHAYERHFDSHEDMAPVGCKYCGSDCSGFRPIIAPCPRCDDDARGVLLSPNVWTACPACKRGGS